MLWAVVVALLCFSPGGSHPRLSIPHFDKVVHFGLWAVLAVLVASESNSMRVHGSITRRAQWLGLLLPAAYGLVVELVQALPQVGRSASLLDWLADVAGAAVAVLCYRPLNRLLKGLV